MCSWNTKSKRVPTHWCGPAVQSTSIMVSKLFVVLSTLRFQELATNLTKRKEPAFLLYHQADPHSVTYPNVAHWHIGICNVTRPVENANQHAVGQWLSRQCKINGLRPISTQIVQSFEHWISYQAQPPRKMKLLTNSYLKSWLLPKLENYLQNPIHSRFVSTTKKEGGRQQCSGMHATKSGKQLETLISLVRERGHNNTTPIEVDTDESDKETGVHASPVHTGAVQSTDAKGSGLGSDREGPEEQMAGGDIQSQQGETPGRAEVDDDREESGMSGHVVQVPEDRSEAVENIMKRRLTKTNTLLLVGQSNGGKSLISRSLCSAFTSVGSCLQGINYSFFLENCLNKRVIHHDECIIVPQVMETYKSSLLKTRRSAAH